MKRYCRQQWLEGHEFLAYSVSTDKLVCLACILFPTEGKHGTRSLLVEKPYQNWKDAKADIKKHHLTQYHQMCLAKMNGFVSTSNRPTG